MWVSLLVALFTAAPGVEVAASAEGPRQVKVLHMLSRKEGLLTTDSAVFLLRVDKGSLRRLFSAQLAAVDPDMRTVLTATRVRGGTELALKEVRGSTCVTLASHRIALDIRHLGWANFRPYAFCAWGVVPSVNGDIRPIFSCLLVGTSDGELDMAPVPVLSGIAQGLAFGSPLFAATRKHTYAGSVVMSVPGQTVLTKSVLSGGPLLGFPVVDSAFVLVRDGQLVRAWSTTGAASGRPIAFSDDGTRLLARVNVPPDERGDGTSYAIIHVDTGDKVPCGYIPDACRVLAVSDDLHRAVVQDYDQHTVSLVAAGRSPVTITQPPPQSAIVGACVSNKFLITDGKYLWEVTKKGRVAERSLREVQ